MMPNEEFSREIHAIDRLIESAVALSWEDLTTSFPPLAMQVEYRSRADGELENLKLWSCPSRGHWTLVCEYRMQSTATHSQGITFNGAYSSAGLAHMFGAIMQHQGSFARPHNEFDHGLVQIAPPDKSQCIAAKLLMVETLERITRRSSSGQITAAIRHATDRPQLPN